MCLICVDLQRERMTLQDARRAYGEMRQSLPPEHAREVEQLLDETAKKVARDAQTQQDHD